MASFRDESFNMSVDHDHDRFDVVWHSTQQPAIQSILEESKLHQRQTSPSAWDPAQASLVTGKSLFKEPSTSRTISLLGSHPATDPLTNQTRNRPGMGRVTSSPSLPSTHPSSSFALPSGTTAIDPRKIRPSQRQTLQASVSSGRGEHERSSWTQSPGSIESLDHLREMVKIVGQTWGRGDSPSGSREASTDRSTRLRQDRTRPTNSDESRLAESDGQSQRSRPAKPKVATTIKVLKVPPHLQKSSSPRLNDHRGLMLPPALPASRKHSREVSDLQFPSKSPIDAAKPFELLDTSMQQEPEDDDSPDTPTYQNQPLLHVSKSLASFEASSGGSDSPRVRQTSTPSEKPRQTTSTATSSLSQPKKALGMRRTLSGNKVEFTSSQLAPSRQTKESLPTIPARSMSYPTSPTPETVLPVSEIPLPPEEMRVSVDLASRSKSFKVPWGSNISPVEHSHQSSSSQQNPPNSQSPTTTVSSSSSPQCAFGINIPTRKSPLAELADTTMDYLANENPDSSYSFDDFDPEELDRVLSQRGA